MMVVTITTAASLAAGSALEGFATEERASALVLLTMLTGAVMIAAGILRLGRYIRFVSRSVMLGFLTGVSVNIVFGQLPDLLGVDTSGGVASQKAWYILTHPGEINWAAAAVDHRTAHAVRVGAHQIRAVRLTGRCRRADRDRRIPRHHQRGHRQ